MQPVFLRDDSVVLFGADCRSAIASLPDESIHAVVTDPPYEVNFAGKAWDRTGVAFDVELWKAVHRVLVPGGYLASFGSTRAGHRMTSAVEDAGFEIRDSLHWIYGQGMPHGDNLKPGHEPITLARKAGARRLQIDACRTPAGRHPSNLLIDELAAAEVDEVSGIRKTSARTSGAKSPSILRMGKAMPQGPVYGDTGGASRFFNVFRFARKVTTNRVHETQKPVEVMEWLVQLLSAPGEVVLDPFMGSGTTGAAALRLGRQFVGIELDEKHFNTAAGRLAATEVT